MSKILNSQKKMSQKSKCHQYAYVTKTQMLPKLNGHKNPTVTKTHIGQQAKMHPTENVTKTQMSPIYKNVMMNMMVMMMMIMMVWWWLWWWTRWWWTWWLIWNMNGLVTKKTYFILNQFHFTKNLTRYKYDDYDYNDDGLDGVAVRTGLPVSFLFTVPRRKVRPHCIDSQLL